MNVIRIMVCTIHITVQEARTKCFVGHKQNNVMVPLDLHHGCF